MSNKHKSPSQIQNIVNRYAKYDYDATKNFNRKDKAAQEFKIKKDVRITIRLPKADLEDIKHRAEQRGLRYQTYLGSIIHQVVEGYIKA